MPPRSDWRSPRRTVRLSQHPRPWIPPYWRKAPGLVLMSVRAPAFPAWARKAAPPPSRKLPTCHAGSPPSMIARLSNAPPSGRTKEWIASHTLSTHAILSAKNSASAPTPATPMIQLFARTSSACKLLRQGDPAELHCDAGGEDHEVEPPACEQADASCQCDEFDCAHGRRNFLGNLPFAQRASISGCASTPLVARRRRSCLLPASAATR